MCALTMLSTNQIATRQINLTTVVKPTNPGRLSFQCGHFRCSFTTVPSDFSAGTINNRCVMAQRLSGHKQAPQIAWTEKRGTAGPTLEADTNVGETWNGDVSVSIS